MHGGSEDDAWLHAFKFALFKKNINAFPSANNALFRSCSKKLENVCALHSTLCMSITIFALLSVLSSDTDARLFLPTHACKYLFLYI